MNAKRYLIGTYSIQNAQKYSWIEQSPHQTPHNAELPVLEYKYANHRQKTWYSHFDWEQERCGDMLHNQPVVTCTLGGSAASDLYVRWKKVKKTDVSRKLLESSSSADQMKFANMDAGYPVTAANSTCWMPDGMWSRIPQEAGYKIPIPVSLRIAEALECIDSDWLQVIKGDPASHDQYDCLCVLWQRLRLGYNQALLKVTYKDGKISYKEIIAIGEAKTISLAPFGLECTGERLIKRDILPPTARHKQIQIPLSLSFCGVGTLRGIVMVPSSQDLCQFYVTNQNPFVETKWQGSLTIDISRLPKYDCDVPTIEIETDSAVFGLHRLSIIYTM